jgi:hypothetical protein
MMRFVRVAAIGMVGVVSMGVGPCELLDPVLCTASSEPAVVVWVYDAETGSPAAHGATGWVREGAYTDTLTPYHFASGNPESLLSLRGADERPGTYEVRVEKAGYEPWTRTGVRARPGTCHVQTVDVDAHLVAVD